MKSKWFLKKARTGGNQWTYQNFNSFQYLISSGEKTKYLWNKFIKFYLLGKFSKRLYVQIQGLVFI